MFVKCCLVGIHVVIIHISGVDKLMTCCDPCSELVCMLCIVIRVVYWNTEGGLRYGWWVGVCVVCWDTCDMLIHGL